ncbi:hypothetical protein B296_00008571 [Ensete ventricosum]|uniref:Uncharacterized protein n=1 Tax=Ensete ventricosum TaxID=4639 RepID=A0A427AS70_ENSVE|nr:hypothetical protein B296_00008571 [Ensete ventricosum]
MSQIRPRLHQDERWSHRHPGNHHLCLADPVEAFLILTSYSISAPPPPTPLLLYVATDPAGFSGLAFPWDPNALGLQPSTRRRSLPLRQQPSAAATAFDLYIPLLLRPSTAPVAVVAVTATVLLFPLPTPALPKLVASPHQHRVVSQHSQRLPLLSPRLIRKMKVLLSNDNNHIIGDLLPQCPIVGSHSRAKLPCSPGAEYASVCNPTAVATGGVLLICLLKPSISDEPDPKKIARLLQLNTVVLYPSKVFKTASSAISPPS